MGAWCTFKVERTSDADGRPLVEADLPKALMELKAVGSWDGLHIFPDAPSGPDGHFQFPWLSAGWETEGQGYVVQCAENTDSMSFFLSTSAELSEPQRYLELGGVTQELWPGELFVPYDLALNAIQHFLSTGLQDPAHSWIGIGDFPRKTVARRLGRPFQE